jgi:uncharacterized membrane protein (UPF0127 family)
MMFRSVSSALGIALLLATAGCKGTSAPTEDATNAAEMEATQTGTVLLRIRSAGDKVHTFTIELAVDDQAQRQGLMGRTSLPDDGGMIFPFPYPQVASFWMKDTPLPLDLIFIRPDGTIAAVLEGKPNDLRPISAGESVSAVLEIARGRADALGIMPGDRVEWGDCASPAPAANAWRADRFCPE